ncbi:hypothetical protein PMIN01_12181 [Paraphaeosphaeria minitans]|uniref:Uncharacterized protein n=1 Tax=Paraphaeosphaeria minitans TaxID=565426 RepID=A0A9P6G7P1_9PLEO|nr:hypothetical protein PMIN01_12181 [Paraphaeosphaeria minitans]
MSSCPTVFHYTTPPLRPAGPPTPPPTEKPYVQAHRVVALILRNEAGELRVQEPLTEFQLAPGEFAEIERLLGQNETLQGYTKDKIRYDYVSETHRLVVRMPTAVHELFIARIEDAIPNQLKPIRDGSDNAAAFARMLYPARSTEIFFPDDNDPATTKAKREPDTSFWHDNARYPGVIIEVAYSQRKERLDRLAESYILDSDASVQAVIGLAIDYGKNGSRKATLSVWWPKLHQTAEGPELLVVREMLTPYPIQAFRDETGNPTDHPGLRLRLSDFACQELTSGISVDQEQDITVSTQELCQHLATAEEKSRGKKYLFNTHSALE